MRTGDPRCPWEAEPIIGRVETVEIKSDDGSVAIPSTTYDVVGIAKDGHSQHKYYITNVTTDSYPRKIEPLVIVDSIAKSYQEVKP